MRRFILLCAFALAATAFGQGADEPVRGAPALGARLVTIESSNVVTRAWRRGVVTVDSEGHLSGDDGIVGEKASTEAIDATAEAAGQISDAANQSMLDAMQYLYSNTNNMATNCVMVALQLEPEMVASNLTGYVVKTTTDGYTDHQWVWYNKVLTLKPNRFITYSYYGGSQKVKAEWVNWTTNGVAVTVDGVTWNGCHECTVARPEFAAGETCLDLPNETWGGDNGIEWGDILLTSRGLPLYTGFVTNGVTGEVWYFDNGFRKPLPTGGTGQ